MSKYSVCLLDDKIPAERFPEEIDQTKLLNRNNFKCMLSKEEEWEEKTLFQLGKDLYEKEDEYEISGFTHHAFFFNYVEENLFSPDIVIFDWDVGDMGGVETDPKANLLKLLRSKYCLVAIYTGADKQNEVTDCLKEEDFSEFGERLFRIKKDDNNSVEALKKEVDKKLELFSFKLGKVLKSLVVQSIDNILVNMGKLSFEQFVGLFGTNLDGLRMGISNIEFVDIFLDKLKYEFNISDLGGLKIEAPKQELNDDNLVRKIWHFRLYHKPNDNIVRKGNIIKNIETNELFLVLSSDCHLNQFWRKNLGHLSVLPLHLVADTNKDFRRRINYYKASQINKYNLTSLVNPSIDSLTILPGLKSDNKGKYFDYALSPRELTSMEIDLGTDDKGKDKSPSRKLTIEDIPGFEKLISISEPFLSALFQFITQNFSGYGLPDFSDGLIKSIQENFKTLKDTN